jgi:glucokinase
MFGMGGEAGHSTVDPEGPLCGCGSYGCLEVFASATGLLRSANRVAASSEATPALQRLIARPEGFTAHDVAQLAKNGDIAACRAFERVGFYLGIGVANLINTLDLPMVVIGGGLANSWDLFAPAMFDSVRRYSVVYRLVEPRQQIELEHHRTFIRPALLGPSAGLLGAGLLPLMQPAVAETVD